VGLLVNVMRPFPLEITAGDIASAVGHRRIAISLLAGTLYSAAPFSIAPGSATWICRYIIIARRRPVICRPAGWPGSTLDYLALQSMI
jgi:hypothetical protein